MRSSEWRWRATAAVLAASLVAAACARVPVSASDSTQARRLECDPALGTRTLSEALTQLRTTTEAAPLYLALASIAQVRECRVTEDAGRIVLDYTFADGGRLHVERDGRIEFTLQEARFASPQRLDAREVLTRAERAAFGTDGCGLDFERGDTQGTKDDGGSRETVYRGAACNCQARVRRDGSDRVTALTLRSAC